MAKKKIEKKKKKLKNEFHISARYAHPLMLVLLAVFFTLFFHEAWLQNKVFIAPDNIASRSFETYRNSVIEKGEQPLWVPYIFSGMPGAQALFVSPNRWYDFIRVAFNGVVHSYRGIFGGNDVFRIVFYHLMFAFAFYAVVYGKMRDPLIAFFSAVSLSFCTGIIIWIMAAHNIKTLSFTAFPLMLIFAELMKDRVKVWHILLLSAALHISFSAHHFQMLYYAYFGIGIYFAFFIMRSLVKKEPVAGYIKAGAAIVLCTFLAFLMISDRYLSTMEYNQYSIRGAAPAMGTDATIGRDGGGLDYDYATGWSFSPQEITTFFIPSFYGFGNWTYEGPLTNYEPVPVNTYFGQMPFTEQPLYMGIVLLALAVIGALIYRRDPFVQYLLILSGISLIISFGRNLPLIYDLMFHYAPLFNSFRVPSMILILLQTSAALLAAYGIGGIIKKVREQKTVSIPVWLRRATAFAASLFILSFLARGVFEGSYTGLIQSSAKPVPPQLYSWMYEKMMNDVSFNLGLLTAAFGLIILYFRRSVPAVVLITGLVLLSVTDLWRIAYRPMSYQPAAAWEQIFRADDAVRFIQQDDSIFRIIRVEYDGERDRIMSDNRMIYHLLQDVNGYHPAKVRLYQDLIDFAGLDKLFVWNLLNVKYVISDREYADESIAAVFRGEKIVHENLNRLPRAWFVANIEESSPAEILNSIRQGNFDPREVAFVYEPVSAVLTPPDSGSSVDITHYGSHRISADVTAAGTHFLVFSEVYYPAGWKAYLSGVETEIVQTNHFQRGIVIPPGEHKLEMTFSSERFELGKNASLASNVLVLGGGLILIAFYYRRKKLF